MISGKLVQIVEANEEEITRRVAECIRRDPEMTHARALMNDGLRRWYRDLVKGMCLWLSGGDRESPARRCETAGKERREQGVPLDECVRGLCLLRETLLDYVEEHTFMKDSMELYAEEELDRRAGRFFDLVTVHVVRGYLNSPSARSGGTARAGEPPAHRTWRTPFGHKSIALLEDQPPGNASLAGGAKLTLAG